MCCVFRAVCVSVCVSIHNDSSPPLCVGTTLPDPDPDPDPEPEPEPDPEPHHNTDVSPSPWVMTHTPDHTLRAKPLGSP